MRLRSHLFAPGTPAGGLVRRVAFWGILLRLFVMPLACHYDLLSYYWAAHEVVYHGQVPLAGQAIGAVYSLAPTAWLNVAWLWLIRPLLGAADPWTHDWFPAGDVYQINEAAWQAFVSVPNIGLTLFLFKLPFLLGECLMIRWLCSLRSSPVQRRRVARFLWLNPVSVFVLYVFGSMEILVLLLLAGCLWCAFHHQRVRTALLIGCGAVVRMFPALFIPALALLFAKRAGARLRLAAWALLPLVVWCGAMELRHPGTLGFLGNYPSMNFLLSMVWPLHGGDVIFPFIVGYVLILGVFTTRRGAPFERFVDAALATLLVFYATSFFHPQYFVWFIPLLALRVATRPDLTGLFVVQVVCFAVYTFHWGRPLAGYLFAPLNPEVMMALRAPGELLASIAPVEKLVGLAHSVLACVTASFPSSERRRESSKRCSSSAWHCRLNTTPHRTRIDAFHWVPPVIR